MEVVRTRDASAEAVARTAVQEDAAAVCVADQALAAEVRARLARSAVEDDAHVLVLAGVPASDLVALIRERLGI
jgi:hypothetical protein